MDSKPLDSNHPSGPVSVRKLKTWVDRDLCIGAATCVAIAPKMFLLDSEAKAIYLTTSAEDTDETIIDAARGCPVAAIFIENIETGERIFPK